MPDCGHPGEIERSVERLEEVDGRRDVEERLGPASAATDAAVLDVPGRQPVRAQVEAERIHQRAVVARAPVPAVDDDDDRVRPTPVRQEQLPELARMGAVAVDGADHDLGGSDQCRVEALS